MPVLVTTPLPNDIAGLKGKVDIYWYRGLMCARSWPRRFTGEMSPSRRASALQFGAVARLVLQAGDTTIDLANAASVGCPWTWRDCLTSGQYGHLISW